MYEELFILHEHCGISYESMWDVPISVRRWWIKRKEKLEMQRAGKRDPNKQDGAMPIPECMKR